MVFLIRHRPKTTVVCLSHSFGVIHPCQCCPAGKITQGQQWVCLHSNRRQTGNKQMVRGLNLFMCRLLWPITSSGNFYTFYFVTSFVFKFVSPISWFPDAQTQSSYTFISSFHQFLQTQLSHRVKSSFRKYLTEHRDNSCLPTWDKTVTILLSTEAVWVPSRAFSFFFLVKWGQPLPAILGSTQKEVT